MTDSVIVTATEAGIEPHLTLEEVAAALGYSAKAVRNRLYAGDPVILALEPTQPIPGGKWLFPARTVRAAFAESGRQRATGFARKARPVALRRRTKRSA